MAVCQVNKIDKKYGFIECPLEPWPDDPQGLCIYHSQIEDKDKEGAFSEAVAAKLANEDYNFDAVFFPDSTSFFREWEFNKPISFRAATFRNADFFKAIFNQEANFFWSTFVVADFSGATFAGASFFWAFFEEANFTKSTFKEKVDFIDAIFTKAIFTEATFADADFSWATFEDADFRSTNFKHCATFYMTTFIDADFEMSIFSGAARFVKLNPSRRDRPSPPLLICDFQDLTIYKEAFLTFQDFSLVRIQFTGTDLRRVEFDRMTWPSWWWRAVVYDEILLHRQRWANIAYTLKHGGLWGERITDEGEEGRPIKPSFEDFAPVERLYRQLKANYEEERDYKRVGDFHYGEMEMHRRGSFWRQWVPFSWYNLYRVLSGYGERPLRAFIWLLLLIPAWAGLVWGIGFNQAGSEAPVSYGSNLLFIIEKALLQRPAWPEGINWLGKLLGSLSVLLIPGQAALFLLALRNRLGRRR